MFVTTPYKGGWITESTWSKNDTAPEYMKGRTEFSVVYPNGEACTRKRPSMKAAKGAITRYLRTKGKAVS